METYTEVFEIETLYTARLSKQLIDNHLKTDQKLLTIKLDISKPTSVREKFLTKQDVLRKLQQSYEKAMTSGKSIKASIDTLIVSTINIKLCYYLMQYMHRDKSSYCFRY